MIAMLILAPTRDVLLCWYRVLEYGVVDYYSSILRRCLSVTSTPYSQSPSTILLNPDPGIDPKNPPKPYRLWSNPLTPRRALSAQH